MPNIEAEGSLVNPKTLDGDYVHVVAAIIWHPERSQEFLIAQRQKGKHLEHLWEFPGGKIEAGETPWQGLQRELVEEIGILPAQGSAFMQVYHRYPDRNILLDFWSIEQYQGKVSACEQQRLEWTTADRSHLYDFPPADMPVLEAIKSSVKAETPRQF